MSTKLKLKKIILRNPLCRVVFLIAVFLPALCAGAALPGSAPAGQDFGSKGKTVVVNGISAPASLFPNGKPASSTPQAILEAMQGIPYRADGAVNERGEFTLFADQKARFDDPGTNCSGFVVAACRFILKKNFTVDEVKKDRLGDSGPDARLGQDWDFGWDLILNISEGLTRTAILPGGLTADPAAGSGLNPRGFEIRAPATWEEIPRRLKPGRLYLISFSVDTARKGYKLLHYHVGLIYVTAKGRAWFYHNTGQAGRSNRRDLSTKTGRESFKKAFADNKKSSKMMFIIEIGQDGQT